MGPEEFAKHAKHNRLLAAMPQYDIEVLLPDMEKVSLKFGQPLCTSGEAIDYIYFPTGAVVSLVHHMVNGASAELAVVGDEGVVGLNLLLGVNTSANSAIVQLAGASLRIRGTLFVTRCGGGAAVQQLVLLYAESLLRHVSITAACNALHSVEQRLCKWLLVCMDRRTTTELTMTQQFIATMLGDRRETIALNEQALQAAGIIRYGRGHMSVLDRTKLEARACECYSPLRRLLL